MTVGYVAQTGDALYTLPNPSAFGFAFSRGISPSGATLPSAVVLRTFDDGATRVFALRPASSVGVVGYTYACDVPMDVHHGQTETGFCTAVGIAWSRYLSDDAAPPSTLADGARVWGWVAA